LRKREIPVEAPVAFEFDGIGYAVMMATPGDLEDFAHGFAMAEGMLKQGEMLQSFAAAELEHGWIVRATLCSGSPVAAFERARRRSGDSSCGLCGVETLATLAEPLPPVETPVIVAEEAMFRALHALPSHQPLGNRTRATHAAAICRPDGTIVLVREDVGRHNALDKAIGAFARQRIEGPHFGLLTARCSYELVEKAVRGGLGALATVSAPTSLACERAALAGLPLHVLARPDSFCALDGVSAGFERQQPR
jgi:FdhD protein